MSFMTWFAPLKYTLTLMGHDMVCDDWMHVANEGELARVVHGSPWPIKMGEHLVHFAGSFQRYAWY